MADCREAHFHRAVGRGRGLPALQRDVRGPRPSRRRANPGRARPAPGERAVRLLNAVLILCLVLILAKLLTQLWLERLNRRHVLAHAKELPEAFKAMLDEATYAKSVQYTLANGRLRQIELVYEAVVLVAVLFSGVLPWALHWFRETLGGVGLGDGRVLFATGLACRCRAAAGMVCPIPPGGTIRFQHDHPKTVVAGPPQRAWPGAGAGLSAVWPGAQAGRVDGRRPGGSGPGAPCWPFNW